MRIRCPNCHNAIEIAAEPATESSRCPACGSVLSILVETETAPATEPRQIEHFQLLEHVGRGHFGDVYRARDTQLERTVAIKLPRLRHLDPTTKTLFLREAQAAAQLHHPHIVTVHEVGRTGDALYIVSDFVDGVTLSALMADRQFTWRDTASLCLTLAEALHFAHERDVVHRDLKPGNVLMDAAGQPHVTDFGLAKREGAEITMTAEGQILGTPAYMSPEQARGNARDADRRSDVYSLGVILYELLVGKRPFRGDTRMLVYQVLHEEPKAPRRVNRDVPRDLETICLKCLAKDPARRYPTAEALADDLRRYLEGRPITARPVSRWERSWRWVRRNRALAATDAFATVAVLALVAFGVWHWTASYLRLRKITLDTEPTGATVVFIPLDAETGEPRPEHRTGGGTSPVRTRLAAGDYLVVAYFDDQRFHEVYRHVPELREGAPEPFRHRRWKEVAGRLELPTVRIPNAMFINEMALVPGRDDFVIGSPALPGIAPPHHRRVPSFLLDTTEVTIGMCKTKLPDWKPLGENMTILPPADFAVFGVSHDQALALAELLGKRLPDETEYEYAATSGGTRDFPWGTAATAPPWSIGPVGAVAEDRVDLDPSHPIFGLCSNVAEWTCSWHTLYPGHAERAAAQAKQRRVVRGGDSTVLDGTPDFDPVRCSPRNRLGVIRQTWKPGLGLRCARSVKPRLEPDDFIRPRPDLDAPQIVPTR